MPTEAPPEISAIGLKSNDGMIVTVSAFLNDDPSNRSCCTDVLIENVVRGVSVRLSDAVKLSV